MDRDIRDVTSSTNNTENKAATPFLSEAALRRIEALQDPPTESAAREANQVAENVIHIPKERTAAPPSPPPPGGKKPKRPLTFSERMSKATQFILLIVLIGMVCVLLYRVYDYYHMPAFKANETIEEAPEPSFPPNMPAVTTQEDKPEPTPTATPQQKLSANTVAKLTVDGVDVTDAAVLKHPTSDDYYLTHDEYDNYSIWGSYFVYHDWNMDSIDSLDKVTVIFGHSNGNSLYRKFSVLKNFKDAAFAQQHQYIYLTIQGITSRWKIFAVCDYPVENNYVIANPTDFFLDWEIQQMKAYSYNTYTTPVTSDDKIMILSTCTGNDNYDTRFIVCAKLDKADIYG